MSNTNGMYNTADGYRALYFNAGGAFNTASGAFAHVENTTGSYNAASGFEALYWNTTGSYNIAIGYRAGYVQTIGDRNIAIGHQGVAAESNTIRIGTAVDHTRAFIAGIRGVTTAGAAIPVLIDVNGQLGTVSSSRRFKDDIADMREASAALMNLRPVTFYYKTDRAPAERRLQYGLVAEEVAEVYPGLVAHSADGDVETVMYQFLPAMLLNEYQKQQRTIENQQRKIETQAASAGKQLERMAELEQDRRLQTARIAELEQKTAWLVNVLEGLAADGTVRTVSRQPW